MNNDFEVSDVLCTPPKAGAIEPRRSQRLSDAREESFSPITPECRLISKELLTVAHQFRFRFATPWQGSAQETHSTLVIPMKQSLMLLTVEQLIGEFLRRLERRYGLIGYSPSKLVLSQPATGTEGLVDLPDQTEAERLYRQMVKHTRGSGAGGSASPYPVPSSAAAAARAHSAAPATCAARTESTTPSTAIDCVMNADDTLDCFLLQTAVQFQQGGSLFDVTVVEWEKGVAAARGEAVQRTLAQAGGSSRNALTLVTSRGDGNDASGVTSTTLPMTQRSTYVDLLLHRRRQQERDRIEVHGFSLLEAEAEDDSDEDWEDGAHSSSAALLPGRQKRRGQAAQKCYEERVKLEEEEQAARTTVFIIERSDWEMIGGLHDDSMRHLLTLEALQGNYVENGQLAALLRKRQVYPYDTLPLVNATSAEDKQRLAINVDNTALMSFRFLEAKQRPEKTEEELRLEEMRAKFRVPREPALTALSAAGTPKTFRTLMAEAVEQERKLQARERREELRREYFLERGEPLPPREPTPPPSPPPPRSPTWEDLPTDTLAAFMDAYTSERHEIIRVERKVFRSFTTGMRSILAKQQEADRLAVERAYHEELEAAERLFQFDFSAFNDVDLLRVSNVPSPQKTRADGETDDIVAIEGGCELIEKSENSYSLEENVN